MKFNPGEKVWCISDGLGNAPKGTHAGTIIELVRTEFCLLCNKVHEYYGVDVPSLRNEFLLPDDLLRPRHADPVEPPGMSDKNPNQKTTWDGCLWQPGTELKKHGKIYVPEE